MCIYPDDNEAWPYREEDIYDDPHFDDDDWGYCNDDVDADLEGDFNDW